MRLLLTRAELDGARTKEKLEALGHDTILCPVIEIVGTGASWPAGVVDAVLASSGHAFAARMDGPTSEVKRLMPLFLVGPRTAETAAAQGFLGAALVAKNSASLAMEIGKLKTRLGRSIYLAGRDRKPDLETALDGIGQELEVIEVYEARPVEAPSHEAVRAFRQNSVDGVLHFSRRSAALFLNMAAAHGLDIQALNHFCLSEDVAIPLRESSLTEVHIASEPNESALLALLQSQSDTEIEDRK